MEVLAQTALEVTAASVQAVGLENTATKVRTRIISLRYYARHSTKSVNSVECLLCKILFIIVDSG